MEDFLLKEFRVLKVLVVWVIEWDDAHLVFVLNIHSDNIERMQKHKQQNSHKHKRFYSRYSPSGRSSQWNSQFLKP